MANPQILNLIMLGTGAHRYAPNDWQNILNMLANAIQPDADQAVHLIDGIGGEPLSGNASPVNPLISSNLERAMERAKWQTFLDEMEKNQSPHLDIAEKISDFCVAANKHLIAVLKSLKQDEKNATVFKNIESKAKQYVKKLLTTSDFDSADKNFLLRELAKIQDLLLVPKMPYKKNLMIKNLLMRIPIHVWPLIL